GYGLSFPKGILLLGVPGCGKSLCAKAVANEWGLPLLRFDPSSLYDKYIGETEKNFRRAISTAEKVAPVVLWIDEIEKALSPSHGSQDGGVSARLFGAFLSWMQERKGDVFVVATANDVEKLPPEFLRKGRFDEIFFVDLPDEESRRSIFEIHLRRRGKDPAFFDLDSLAQAAAGFSGSEIEQVIISALYTAFSSNTELTTELILDEIYATVPLSITMKERIEYLRDWALGRAVSAHG
ncbi:MAG: AAA family ATPase, partial [Candidatus Methanosuratincola sp.]